MILVGYIDGTPLSAAEKLAGEIELLYFARRSNETLWAAMNKIEPMRQHELETKMTEMIHAAIAAAISAEREACAKVADQYGTNAERRAASHDNGAARNAALDKFEAAINIALAIRERTQPQ